MSERALRLLVLVLIVPLLGGSCDDPDEPPEDCDQRFGYEAKGEWQIRAEGKRSGCSDPKLNGHMTLDVRRFAVDGMAVATHDDKLTSDTKAEADRFVERIERAKYVLEKGKGAPSGLTFSGDVRTCELRFEIAETLPSGDVHQYVFDGFLRDAFSGYGRFSGTGPGDCRVEGEFDLTIR